MHRCTNSADTSGGCCSCPGGQKFVHQLRSVIPAPPLPGRAGAAHNEAPQPAPQAVAGPPGREGRSGRTQVREPGPPARSPAVPARAGRSGRTVRARRPAPPPPSPPEHVDLRWARRSRRPVGPPAVAVVPASAAHTRPRPTRQPRAPRRTCAFRRDFERSCPWSPCWVCGSGRGKTTPARSLLVSAPGAAFLSAGRPSPGQMPISSDPVTEGRKGRAPQLRGFSRRSHFRE
jgi:hypothetical protein